MASIGPQCVCDCAGGGFVNLVDGLHEDDDANWQFCECIHCGNGRCRVRCRDEIRFFLAVRLIREVGSFDPKIDRLPRLCSICQDHYVKDIHQRTAAVAAKDSGMPPSDRPSKRPKRDDDKVSS